MINNTEQLLSLLGNDEAELIHGEERYKLTIETRPRCTQNCPAGINVKGYVNLIANRRYAEALELIREMNPFPGICGRVCTRPCEINCNPDLGEPLSIKALKRFVADYEVSRTPADIERYPVRYREKVAVIGSGPAGLTTAVDLVRLGYAVTVFEAMNKAGGMLTWGIPEFRLPRNVLEREIKIIESMGVEIRTGKRIEDPTSLFSEGYNAVVIAAGSWKGLPLEIEGEDLEGVVDCLEFLRMVSRRELGELSGRVVVIGGGESAVDAARTALRLGADAVTLAYRRTENEMPAENKEVRDTREEGAEIMTLAIPRRIIGDGKVEGIEFLRAELGDIDESGRGRPIPIRGSEFVLECDWIIPAISARPGVPGFSDRGICFNEKGLINVDEAYQSCIEGIFAVGDAVRGPSTIVDVIGSAHRCAASIHAFLGSKLSKFPSMQEFSQGTRAGAIIHKAHHRPKHRHPIPGPSLDERLECFMENEKHYFTEIEDVYSELVAVDEASRCFRCGPCEECLVCLPNCTEKQIVGSLNGKEFLLKVSCELSREVHEGKKDDWELSVNNERKPVHLCSLTPRVKPELCIACGRCEDACAYKAVRVELKTNGKAYSTIDHDVCRSCGRCVLACPTGAITLDMYGESKLRQRIKDSILANDGIAVLGCHWSTPPKEETGIEAVEFMCSVGLISATIIQALASGARGVLILHCGSSIEHYLDVSYGVEEIVTCTRDLLSTAGINPNRVMLSSSVNNPKWVMNGFRTQLLEEGLEAFQPVKEEEIPGRIGRQLAHLSALSAQEGSKGEPSLLLKGKVLRGAGMSDTLEMLESARYLSNFLGIRLDHQNIEEAVLSSTKFSPGSSLDSSPESSPEYTHPESLTLPTRIVDTFSGLSFDNLAIRVGIHRSCSSGDSVFFEPILAILDQIPGCEVVELEPMECGATGWCHPDASARKKALLVFGQAEELGVDMIIPTSADCLTHLRTCNFPGAWRYSSVETMDIYTFLVGTLSQPALTTPRGPSNPTDPDDTRHFTHHGSSGMQTRFRSPGSSASSSQSASNKSRNFVPHSSPYPVQSLKEAGKRE